MKHSLIDYKNDVISLDNERIRLSQDENGEVIYKKSTINEYVHLLQASNMLNCKTISIQNTVYSIEVPQKIDWNDTLREISYSYIKGSNLELMLRNPNTYILGKQIVEALFFFLQNEHIYWLDFAPRNVLLNFDQQKITLVDFERGFHNGTKEEYQMCICEEYSLFLLPQDNYLYKLIDSYF